MKKVICVAAAFMMVAGVATVASAVVDLSGSARARLIYNDSGENGVDSDTRWDSRVRVKIHAKTEGGGYVKARVRFLDGTWGQGGDYSPFAKSLPTYDNGKLSGGNVWSDYAYVGFKVGNLDIAGGKMPIAFSPWFLDDERSDRFRVLYKDGGLALAFTYDKKIYETYGYLKPVLITDDIPLADGSTDAVVGYNYTPADGDKDVWGVTYRQKFSDAVKLNVRAVYVSDGTYKDMDGIKGSANLDMSFGGNNIILEQSYKAGDTAEVDSDDQYGGYAEWNATYGSITPTARIGYTMDGFSSDETFGWLMFGGDVPTSQVQRIGSEGDTMFVGLSSKFQTSEQLSFTGNLVYMNVDDEGKAVHGENPFEISGQAKYQVGKGVEVLARVGYLKSDGDLYDDAFSAYTQMEVTF